MRKLFITFLMLFLISGFSFTEDMSFSLKTKPTKTEKGLLIGMTIIVVSIAAPVLYEGYRIANK